MGSFCQPWEYHRFAFREEGEAVSLWHAGCAPRVRSGGRDAPTFADSLNDLPGLVLPREDRCVACGEFLCTLGEAPLGVEA